MNIFLGCEESQCDHGLHTELHRDEPAAKCELE